MQPYIGIITSVPTLKVLHPMHNNISASQIGIITTMPIPKVLLHLRTIHHCTTISVQLQKKKKKKREPYNAQ